MLNDLRFALRMLWTHPVFTIIAIATMALAIGANTFGGVTLALAFVAMCASHIPARRATKADPMIALGHAQ